VYILPGARLVLHLLVSHPPVGDVFTKHKGSL
jgi:hypothetical protein